MDGPHLRLRRLPLVVSAVAVGTSSALPVPRPTPALVSTTSGPKLPDLRLDLGQRSACPRAQVLIPGPPRTRPGPSNNGRGAGFRGGG